MVGDRIDNDNFLYTDYGDWRVILIILALERLTQLSVRRDQICNYQYEWNNIFDSCLR